MARALGWRNWGRALLACALVGLVLPAASAAAETRPNVIVVMTDDQIAGSMNPRVMPAVNRLVVERGVRFKHAIASSPLCCPSRATFLSGQYGHNNGVLWNSPGYPDLLEPDNVLPAWLREAGYRTIHVGKYPNGYESVLPDERAVPSGWDEWHSVVGPVSYYGMTYNVNGRIVRTGDRPHDYISSHLNRVAGEMIERFAPKRRPFFLAVDHFAPHRAPTGVNVDRCPPFGPEPALRDRGAFRHAVPRSRSINEADVSDKPSFIQSRPPIPREQLRIMRKSYGCALASLQEVDRGMKEIWRRLGETESRRDTVIVFTSDNGFFYGEHRLDNQKWIPYPESFEVPLAIRIPGASSRQRGRAVRAPVANADLPATIVDLAGAEPCVDGSCRVLDGRSLVGLLDGGRGTAWNGRAIPLEIDSRGTRVAANSTCTYHGLFTLRYLFVQHTAASDARTNCQPVNDAELYGRDDPFQLDNAAAAGLTPEFAPLAARALSLSTCAGIEGRDPAPPPGRAYCE